MFQLKIVTTDNLTSVCLEVGIKSCTLVRSDFFDVFFFGKAENLTKIQLHIGHRRIPFNCSRSVAIKSNDKKYFYYVACQKASWD